MGPYDSAARDAAILMQAVFGAGETVDVLANLDPSTGVGGLLAADLEGVLASADQRLSLRCIIHWPEDATLRGQDPGAAFGIQDGAFGWGVRALSTPPSMDLMIVDAMTAYVWRREGSDVAVAVVSDETTVGHLQAQFDELWTTPEHERDAVLIYEDVLRLSFPDHEREIVRVSQETWDHFISELARSPEKLHSLDPRRFEELVCELLGREGMDARLTPRSADGGRDILVVHRGSFGEHLYLAECKRYSPKRPIGVDLVRALYGVVEQERATAGLLVTTSRFTAPALEFATPIRYRLSLKDYSDLVEWIRRHVRLPRG